jgi:DNA-binding transcriptional LysR family regulator
MGAKIPSWDDLRVLLAVHRHESLLAAGRALGLSTSTTARRLERLERRLGRKLVVRSTTGTSLEPGALELVELAEQLEHGLAAAQRTGADPGGTVRVSAGDGFAVPMTAVLASLRRAHPETLIELISETRVADLARREADIGIRTARSTSAALVEVPLGKLSFSLFASRAYVARRLRSTRLGAADFERLDFVGYVAPLDRLPQAVWLDRLGARRFVFRSNADAALLEATRQGQGVAALADVAAAGEPELVRLECATPGPLLPVWLASHRDLRKTPRVRRVAAALEEGFRARLHP